MSADKQTWVRELLQRMSIADKTGQLNLLTGTMDATGMQRSEGLEEKIKQGQCGAVLNVYTPDATKALQEIAMQSPLKIPLMFGYDVIHGHRTIFPIPLGLSCSWNLELIERCARAMASDAAADGLHWVFAPMADISHDPRWGRVAEGAGEDPWLASQIVAAIVRGLQGKSLSATDSVAACVKHVALYGATRGGRDYHTVDMGRREMEETYFPPYRAAIEAGARTAMAAFTLVDGIPATSNRWLLTEMLRERWGFGGLLVTDFNAIAELKCHGVAADNKDAARLAFDAGADMDMVSEAFLTELPDLVRDGRVSAEHLDAAVARVLELKWDLGLFETPFARCAQAAMPYELNRNLAREAARESIVLLKNDGGILPLPRRGIIAVIGPLADQAREMLGCWHAAGNDAAAVSPLAGIKAAAGGAAHVVFAAGHGSKTERAEAVRLAGEADVVILVVGESRDMSGEAASRTDIRLPKGERKLARRVLKTGKPCILVTVSGRPLDLSREAGKFPAILHAFAPGIEAGNALADVIFGKFAPVGKLTMGFPRSVGQLPMTYREMPGGRPFDEANPYTSRYLDCENDALFPFGHGLTYGEMVVRGVRVAPESMTAGGSIEVIAEIHNPGPREVTETLQLYLNNPVASISRPVKELKGFRRISLGAGETSEVRFEITDTELAFPGADFEPTVEGNEFVAMIGNSSQLLTKIRFSRF